MRKTARNLVSCSILALSIGMGINATAQENFHIESTGSEGDVTASFLAQFFMVQLKTIGSKQAKYSQTEKDCITALPDDLLNQPFKEAVIRHLTMPERILSDELHGGLYGQTFLKMFNSKVNNVDPQTAKNSLTAEEIATLQSIKENNLSQPLKKVVNDNALKTASLSLFKAKLLDACGIEE